VEEGVGLGGGERVGGGGGGWVGGWVVGRKGLPLDRAGICCPQVVGP
jgi:hypothetical protein